MIKKFWIILLFLNIVCSQNDETLWNAAIESYRVGDYQAATSSLLSVTQQNAALFMLLSDCYKQIGQPIIAQMYRQKAFIHGSWLQKWRILQERYKEEHVDWQYSVIQSSLDLLYSIILSIPLLFFQMLFLLFVCLLLFCHRRILQFFSALALVFVCVGGIYKNNLYRPRGIALVNTVVRNFADDTAPVVAEVNVGIIVYYVDQQNGFYKLKDPRGWVRIDDIARII